jgi:hypothetical protein
MDTRLRTRFWIEVGLGVASAVLLVLTLITREWVELIFGAGWGERRARVVDRGCASAPHAGVRRARAP